MSTTSTKTVTQEWHCPPVTQGEIVEYSSDGTFNPSDQAFVSRVEGDCVWLQLQGGMRVVEEVRHADDPILKKWPQQIEDGGCWRESATTRRLNLLEAQVEKLTEQLAKLNMPRRGRPPKQDPVPDES